MEIAKSQKTAILFGATGLVGSFCLSQLLAHEAYDKVIAFVRRPLYLEHPKLQVEMLDFEQLERIAPLIRGNDLYCCLGTTMAKAGSREAFYRVDFTYPQQIAAWGLANGVSQFLLVSSVGADADSLFYYSRVKGELEEHVSALPFWAVHIFQPSVLLGERNENRWGEQLAGRIVRGVDRLTGGLLSKYRPVEAEVVAAAMLSAAQGLKGGVHVHASHELQRLAEEER